MVSPPFLVSVCPSPALVVGWFGHRSVASPAAPVCWALVGSLLRRSVALAYCHTLSFCCFFLWHLFGLGLLGCGPAWVPAFFWGNSPSLVLVVFTWRFLLLDCPGSLSFLGLFAGVLSSRFQCLLIARGGCG